MYVLSGIILINIIAIVILSMQTQEPDAPTIEQTIPVERQIVTSKPAVKTLIIEDRNECPLCFDIDEYLPQLDDVVNMTTQRASPEDLGLQYYPALAFNSTILEYPESISGGWAEENIVTIDDQTWYVLYTLNPPFYDRNTSETRGLVTATYLTMDSCDDCYDLAFLKDLIADQRMTITEEFVFDAETPAGQAVVRRYNITAVPTVILDEEAGVYPGFASAWRSVGTEEEGSFVLRELERLQVTYYDLETRRVMRP